MLLIIAHHYVANSGLMASDGPVFSDINNPRSMFLLIFGAWGKTGINCFFVITAYYMCKSRITSKKFLKLLLEFYFYNLTIYGLFLTFGYAKFSLKTLLLTCFPFTYIDKNFTSCFLIFYLLIPFLNMFVRKLNEWQHLSVTLLLLLIYVIGPSVPKITIVFNYVTWFCVMYIITSYVSLYPKKIWSAKKLWKWVTIILILFASISIILGVKIPVLFDISPIPYEFVSDVNKIFPVGIAISSFLMVRNITIRNSVIINRVAATTFGVLCIHANSDIMRNWLWVDLLNNVSAYNERYMVLHAVLSVLAIFIICSVIDMIRIRFIEKPLFDRWNLWGNKLENFFMTCLKCAKDSRMSMRQ